MSIFNRSNISGQHSDCIFNGSNNNITGDDNIFNGSNNRSTGNDNVFNGSNNRCTGRDNIFTGSNNHCTGNDNVFNGSNNIGIGRNNVFRGGINNMSNGEPVVSSVRGSSTNDATIIIDGNIHINNGIVFSRGNNITVQSFGSAGSGSFPGVIVGNENAVPTTTTSQPVAKTRIKFEPKGVDAEIKDDGISSNSLACAICLTNKKCVSVTCCGQVPYCIACASKILLEKGLGGQPKTIGSVMCPLCRANIEGAHRIYI